ncbi:FkbM family methyltransferase [Halalkalicoccus jeotgali]|uniref:SAM-dependent methyltransferase n=1 Tax=Halalkalicoccus jeotgali (strain DSM 18796 / CECT 7217 / JCM 14584 / KCTC 4019 / B3) TaxID=795797 RepID=D8J9T8_HALJB|nr:FkbM family methyltransferase [Halalkalicoccus jeotgali]ADJ16427.1 SAM-dependent methyltransferase [Halalkalicoccus jeotgali B3]ELY37161.1 SAM-dependent methyltransferase [Halalkalicoccus jeotgali B3]
MPRNTTISGALLALFRALYRLPSVLPALPNAVYYRLAGANYRYQLVATEKRVREGSFRSYELYHRHGNDWLLAALLDRCRDGDVVVDVGANTGVYSLSVAAEYPDATAVAIEPNPEIAGALRANVAASGFEDRIGTLELGVGAEEGSLPFYRSSYHELGSFNRFNAARFGAHVVGTETVPIRTLDALVSTGRVPPPDHLKVDVEGFGPEVLRGAREVLATHRPFVYVEPHARHAGEPDDRGESAAGMRELLAGSGYAIIPGEDGWICLPESP